jgi:peptidoglycan/LPS O-acetylase OafA/YrhL
MQVKAARETFPGLDLVRFAAAISVTVYHLAYWWWLPEISKAATHPLLVEPVRWGWAGVQIFFVLSGFVISYSAEGKTLAQFATSRALRLFPAAWICATFTLLATRSAAGPWLGDYLRSMLLSPVGPWISGVYWTLGVEIVFYLAVAVALWQRVKLWNLCLLLGGLSSAYWLVRALDFALGGPLRTQLGAFDTPLGGLTLLPHGCFFAIGMALREWSTGRLPRSGPRLALLCSLAGMVALTASGRFYVASQGGRPWQAIEPTLFWLAGLVLIVACIRWNPVVERSLGRFALFARQVGLATYPLYLIHNEVGRALMLRSTSSGPIFSLVFSVAAMVALAFLITFLERYPRNALKRLVALRRLPARPLVADLP